MVGRIPFCHKDPRLSYTLPAWRPQLPDTGRVCVFRHPALTVLSIVEECRNARYLHNLDFDLDRALGVWEAMYRQILDHHRLEGNWLFVRKDQLLADAGLDRLADFLQAPHIDRRFPERALNRPFTPPAHPPPLPGARILAWIIKWLIPGTKQMGQH